MLSGLTTAPERTINLVEEASACALKLRVSRVQIWERACPSGGGRISCVGQAGLCGVGEVMVVATHKLNDVDQP